jgi:hypothetical protein
MVHLRFVAEIMHDQLAAGRYFLFEHPIGASSWQEECLKSLRDLPSVNRVTTHQCQFGQEILHGKHKGRPIQKPTGFLSNSPEMLKALDRQCKLVDGQCSREQGGEHLHLHGDHARRAARYPKRLCKAILQGAHAQLRADGHIIDGCIGLVATEDPVMAVDAAAQDARFSGKHKDDLTGQLLRDDLVREARRLELQYFADKGVWARVPTAEAKRRTGKPAITVRWVDINKGDDLNPRYRSRLVARQLKCRDSSGASYFAPAPPLEALRTILSLATTEVGGHVPNWEPLSEDRTQLLLLDISRAYFNAKEDQENPTYVQLPPEDPDRGQCVAKLLRCMYGTRAAADGWQTEYSTMLVQELGFAQGTSCANVFRHDEKSIRISVHGDDFQCLGGKRDLDWFEAEIRKHYECTVQPRLGPGPADAKTGLVLNRVVHWNENSLSYEADPRQLERLITECGLDGAKPVATPGTKATADELAQEQPLREELKTTYRSSSARCNYVSADRPDASFACKEICRWMSAPSTTSWQSLKRLVRFFCGAPRLVYDFPRQVIEDLDIYTDTDWAGCGRTRKSTSGGLVMFGRHCLKHWASTQASVTLSSGEAEFHGLVKGAAVALGQQALYADLGLTVPIRLWTDSSAAIGITSRQGLGKLRHVDTKTLWLQQAARTGRVQVRKVPGLSNPADLLTKHSLSKERILELMRLIGCSYAEGRPGAAPDLKEGPGNRKTMAQAEAEGLTAEISEMELGMPLMPHTCMSLDQLDLHYPAMVAPAEVDDPDLDKDEDDLIYSRGLELAAKIGRDMATYGRTRREGDVRTAQDHLESHNSTTAATAGTSSGGDAGTAGTRRQ